MAHLSYLALFLLVLLALSYSSSIEHEDYEDEDEDHAKKLQQDPYFEDIMKIYCPVRTHDGEVCGTQEYEDAKDNNQLKELREKSKKHHQHHHRGEHLKKHLAETFCCMKKDCLLKCKSSTVLAGFPGNLELLKMLDSDYVEKMYQRAAENEELNVVNSFHVLLMESTDHFEKLMAQKDKQLTVEQQQLALSDYENLTKSVLTVDFPQNLGILLNMDEKQIFGEMSEYTKMELLCDNGCKLDQSVIDYWKLIVGLNTEYFEHSITHMTDFTKLETYTPECEAIKKTKC